MDRERHGEVNVDANLIEEQGALVQAEEKMVERGASAADLFAN